MIPVRLRGTASLLPGPAVSTVELSERLGRNPAAIERKTGIRERHFAPPGTLAADLGAAVLGSALARAGLSASELSRIVFVSSTGGDALIPATANRVAARLGLAGSCDAFDLNNACMGFLTAFDVAARSVATGLGPTAIVVVELGSRCISDEDHRPRLVFADAAAAAIVDAADPGPGAPGILGAALSNDGTLPADVVMDHPLLTGKLERVRFDGSTDQIARAAVGGLQRATDGILARAGVALGEIEWILPHQPNGFLLKLIIETFGFDPAKTVPVVQETGSIGAASIPVSLDRLLRTRPVRPGDRILMIGVGAGVSCGALLLRVP